MVVDTGVDQGGVIPTGPRVPSRTDESTDASSVVASATRTELAAQHVQALDDANLIALRAEGGQPVVVPAHPLYGELLREALGFTATREANRAVLDGVGRLPSVPDALRAAVWQRDAGTLDHPAIAIVGARAALARHDAVLTEQLVRPFAAGSADAGILVGRALNMQRRYEEAEQILCSIEPTDPSSASELASARAHNLAFGLGTRRRRSRSLPRRPAQLRMGPAHAWTPSGGFSLRSAGTSPRRQHRAEPPSPTRLRRRTPGWQPL